MTTAPARARARSTDASRETVREEPTQSVPAGRAYAIGRDGKPIWRRMSDSGADPYGHAASLAPPGWSYEWKTWSVYGVEDKTQQATYAQQGWTPVPAERHDGVFMPVGYTGPIISGGLILMERPEELTIEARREEKQRADGRVHNAKTRLGLVKPDGVGDRISTETRMARDNTFVRVHRDDGSEIERPKREIAIDQ